jgi:hypothetical protein
VDKIPAGFLMAAVARAQSLVVGSPKVSGVVAFYGFSQLGDLSLEDGIQNVRDVNPVFHLVQTLGALHGFFQFIKLVCRQV